MEKSVAFCPTTSSGKTFWTKNFSKVIILEDDIHFYDPQRFRHDLKAGLDELDEVWHNVDLIYLGRKSLKPSDELRVYPSFVRPKYSYWTIAYILTYSGALKLVSAEPLSKIVPVDEYLPIMFDESPHSGWAEYFPKRDLVALSFDPLLISPSQFIGDEGYISDTEESEKIKEDWSQHDHPKYPERSSQEHPVGNPIAAPPIRHSEL